MKIAASDSCAFMHPPKLIYETILDFKSYYKWWPKTIKFKVLNVTESGIGSQIKVNPYGGTGFILEIIEAIENEKIVMEYLKGIYSGKGTWTVKQLEGKTKLTYDIELTVENFIIKMLSSLFNTTKMHSNLMKKVFTGLEKLLNNS